MKKIVSFNEHSNCRDILTAGKQIEFGKVKGYINSIQGNDVWVEVLFDGTNESGIQKFNLVDIIKKMKTNESINESIEYYAGGELIQFLEDLEDPKVETLLDDLLEEEDLENKKQKADNLLAYLEDIISPEEYLSIEDAVRDLAID